MEKKKYDTGIEYVELECNVGTNLIEIVIWGEEDVTLIINDNPIVLKIKDLLQAIEEAPVNKVLA